MSLHETPLLRRYWDTVGGTLIEEFLAVAGAPGTGKRLIDGVIVLGGEKRRASRLEVSLRGQHLISVQVKRGQLGMYLMGQALFSAHLLWPFGPASVQAVALCEFGDAVLGPLFERHLNCRVVTLADLPAEPSTPNPTLQRTDSGGSVRP